MSGAADVLVVGRGAAGALAALAARAAGASVQLVAAGGGATELGSGAWDVAGSQRLGPEADQPLCTHAAASAEGTAGLAALAWCAEQLDLALRADGPMPLLVTEAGRLRRAAAHDPALLDLSRLPRATVAVAALAGHPSFDAAWLARRLDAHGQDRRFAAVELDFVRRGRDRLLHPAELAALLDEDRSARAALARAIVRGLGGLSFDAVLVPPMLGLDAPLRAELEGAAGLPIGEIVSGPGAVAGLRLVRQLARRLEAAGVRVHAGRVETVERAGRLVRVRTDGAELRAERLVLATGGHLGGGFDVDAVPVGARLLGLAQVEVEGDGRVRGLSGPLAEVRVHACGEAAGLTAEAGLLAVAASALRAGFSAAT